MEKKDIKQYNFDDGNSENNILREPAIEYDYQAETDMEILPPPSEEELKNLLTKEELLERVIPRIKKFFE